MHLVHEYYNVLVLGSKARTWLVLFFSFSRISLLFLFNQSQEGSEMTIFGLAVNVLNPLLGHSSKS